MKKTLTFASIHFTIAFTVAYLLTGDILIGSMIAMKSRSLQRLAQSAKVKTTSFAVIHFSVAFSVVYLLTGDAFVGGIMAAIEPTINTCAYYFHEKVWLRKQAQHQSAQPWACAH